MTTRLASLVSTWMTIVAIVICSETVSDDAMKTSMSFLIKYGYLNENVSNVLSGKLTKESAHLYSQAIALFQDYYRLPGNGTLNEETLNLMRRPRCGLEDISERALGPLEVKWPKKHLKWNFHMVTREALQVTQFAFDLWAANSSLTFERDRLNPDIVISFREGFHTYSRRNREVLCPAPFDGPGKTLAHAFLPTGQRDFVSEIHVDHSEPWHISLDENPPGTDNLLQTLTHEIGHALGLSHTNNPDSIMYSFAPDPPETAYPVKLHLEDVLSIQHLYGTKIDARHPMTTTMAPPTRGRMTTTTTTTTTTTKQNLEKDLCAIRKIDNVLLLNDRIYVARDRRIWSIDLNKKTFERPLELTDYMSFLPDNFTRLSGVYQRPTNELVLFVDSQVYMVEYPSFKLLRGWPKSYPEIGLPEEAKVNAAVNTNRGQSFVIYDNRVVGEIDDCSMQIVRYHTIDHTFPGIPNGVSAAFRYADGNLYFLHQRQFYRFNEFTKTVTTAGRFDMETLGVVCPTDGLMQRLRDLLERFVRLSSDKDASDSDDESDDGRS